MIRHPFTLEALAREWNTTLYRSILRECYVREDSALVMCFENADAELDLEFSVIEPIVGAFVRSHSGRPRKGTRDIFSYATDSLVSSITKDSADRIIHIHTQRVEIYLHFFSGNRANAVLCNGDGIVLDALHHASTLVRKEYTTPPLRLESMASMPPQSTLLKALANSDIQLGSYYAEELCSGAGLNTSASIDSIDLGTLATLEKQGRELATRCRDSNCSYLLRSKSGNEFMSLIELPSTSETLKRYDSVNDGVQWSMIGLFRSRAIESMRQRLGSMLKQQIHKTSRAIEHMMEHERNGSKAEQLSYLGDLLLSQQDVHQRGLEHIELKGWSDEPIEVKLDARANLAENAQMYYDKARRSREALKVSRERLPKFKKRLEELKAVEAELQGVTQLDEIRQLNQRLGMDKDTKTEKSSPTDASKYREFELDSDFTVFVGRSAQNNDELTMRFAKQNDIWLHARGVSGSHAVLRSKSQSKAPKKIIEQAASIAAYYSKARNAGYTPVVYTQRKYVRKPKGAAVGAVVLEREEVIMVAPSLPPGAKED